jgi:hypothetical protein
MGNTKSLGDVNPGISNVSYQTDVMSGGDSATHYLYRNNEHTSKSSSSESSKRLAPKINLI